MYEFEILNTKTNEQHTGKGKTMRQACESVDQKVTECKCISRTAIAE